MGHRKPPRVDDQEPRGRLGTFLSRLLSSPRLVEELQILLTIAGLLGLAILIDKLVGD